MESAAAPQINDRELSSAEAPQAFIDLFRDFDLRVMNQRILDRHAADSVKAEPLPATVNPSETTVNQS